jgi:hypothetical protein
MGRRIIAFCLAVFVTSICVAPSLAGEKDKDSLTPEERAILETIINNLIIQSRADSQKPPPQPFIPDKPNNGPVEGPQGPVE